MRYIANELSEAQSSTGTAALIEAALPIDASPRNTSVSAAPGTGKNLTPRQTLRDWFSARWFQLVHRQNLVYNTCWEDPRLDRQALRIGPGDRIAMITSAGCNALDYLLDEPQQIFAVDVNPLQNALLELKIAAIRRLEFSAFFQMFGQGRLADCHEVYHRQLRPELSPAARACWDSRIRMFGGRGPRESFYFRGSAGLFARLVNAYIDRIAKVRDGVEELLATKNVAEQREIFHDLQLQFWGRLLRWTIGRDISLALVGVPRPQREQIDRDYPGGVVKFIEDCMEAVFGNLPLQDNYFWRVYLTGEYTPDCCPEYLKPDNFERLKSGLVDRISVHTSTMDEFLAGHDGTISKFVLLDHMDWLSSYRRPLLEREWQEIVDRAAPGARLLWRSAGLRTDFVDTIPVHAGGRTRDLGEILQYDHGLAARLHPLDRVHTYGSLWIADLINR